MVWGGSRTQGLMQGDTRATEEHTVMRGRTGATEGETGVTRGRTGDLQSLEWSISAELWRMPLHAWNPTPAARQSFCVCGGGGGGAWVGGYIHEMELKHYFFSDRFMV